MARKISPNLGKTFKFEETEDQIIRKGTFGLVFKGYFKTDLKTPWKHYGKQEEVAIKRVQLVNVTSTTIENDRDVNALKILRHSCIVKLLAIEDDTNFRYFMFEMCKASLEDFILNKYKGTMPEKIEGLRQIASGLEHINKNKMIHRDIKPENVFISITENEMALLKISDFEFTKRLKDNETHYDSMASGIKGGLHPFGSGYEIEDNILLGGKPINLNKEHFDRESQWLHDLVKNVIQLNVNDRLPLNKVVCELESRSPDVIQATELLTTEVVTVEANLLETSNIVDVGDQGLKFDRNKRMCKESFAGIFKGYLKDKKVAIKRIQLLDSRRDDSEIINLSQLDHSNIVRFIHHEDDAHFRYLVFELCDASLEKLISKEYTGSLPTKEQVIFQLASGLHHIHSKNIVHGNIKPEKILISYSKPMQLKWIVTDLNRTTNGIGSLMWKDTKRWKWVAPEVIAAIEKATDDSECPSIKSDVFSAGCVFFYYVTRGVHPFGKSDSKIYTNIVKGNPTGLESFVENSPFALPFVKRMLEKEPIQRIQLSEVIKYFESRQHNNIQQPRISAMSFSQRNTISKGSYSHVYRIPEYEGIALAVKKVEYFEGYSEETFEKLMKLNHPNVVRLHFFDNDNFEGYFGMELCQTSLERLFLPDDDPKKFRGQIPEIKDEVFCLQLASGLQYIHSKKLVHRSIKPSNILITNTTSGVWQIKLSDFGLTPTSRRVDQGNASSPRVSGFQDWVYWLAPELIEAINNKEEVKFTEKSDIFSAGSVLFYFSSQGSHLYSEDVNNIIPNTLAGSRENLSKKLNFNIFPMGLIRWMTAKEPEHRPDLSEVIRSSKLPLPMMPSELKITGDIKYSTDHVIGEKDQVFVFNGFFKSSSLPVAIKRFNNIDAISNNGKHKIYNERDCFALIKHVNIVKLFGSAEEGPFLLLALEKCLTTLHDYCRKPLLYRGIVPMPSDCEVLLQMAEGLHFIHEKKIIHRDVKPANVLISYDKPAIIKWADFGMSRAVTTESRTFSWSKLKGTERWMAPELLEAKENEKVSGSIKCDIFALGCVYFFFLVPGKHPFGNDIINVDNVKKGNRVLLHELSQNQFAFEIVKQMTEKEEKFRPELLELIKYLSFFLEQNPSNSKTINDITHYQQTDSEFLPPKPKKWKKVMPTE